MDYRPISSSAHSVGLIPFGVAITPDGKFSYVTNLGDGMVSVIDTATNATVGSPITVGRQPRGVAITPCPQLGATVTSAACQLTAGDNLAASSPREFS